jgi:hypothetical protein
MLIMRMIANYKTNECEFYSDAFALTFARIRMRSFPIDKYSQKTKISISE